MVSSIEVHLETALAQMEQALWEVAAEYGGVAYRDRLKAISSPPEAAAALFQRYPTSRRRLFQRFRQLGVERRTPRPLRSVVRLWYHRYRQI